MAKQKTNPTTRSVAAYIAGQKDEVRRDGCNAVLGMMQRATKLEPTMWGTSIVGFGKYHYKYASGHEGDTCYLGFSSRKDSIVLYLSGGLEASKDLLATLGKHKRGKGCLYIKSIDEVDQAVLEKVIRNSLAWLKDYLKQKMGQGEEP